MPNNIKTKPVLHNIQKLKNIEINNNLYFCQLVYEDIDGHPPFIDISILKKCHYNQDNKRVIFEDESYLDVYRPLTNEFRIHKFKDDLYFHIKYCGLFYNLDDVKQNINILQRQLNKQFDRIVVREK